MAELSGLNAHHQQGGNKDEEEVQEVRRRLDQVVREKGEVSKENKILQQKVQLLHCIERQHSDQTNRLKVFLLFFLIFFLKVDFKFKGDSFLIRF